MDPGIAIEHVSRCKNFLVPMYSIIYIQRSDEVASLVLADWKHSISDCPTIDSGWMCTWSNK